MANNPLTPTYTGNHVQVNINGNVIGLVETLTVSRSVNRHQVYAIGSPLFVDAPVTQANVTVTATSLVPVTATSGLPYNNVNPSGSLLAELSQTGYTIEVINPDTGAIEYSAINAFYNQDAVQVPMTDVLTLNLSWIAQDTGAWH